MSARIARKLVWIAAVLLVHPLPPVRLAASQVSQTPQGQEPSTTFQPTPTPEASAAMGSWVGKDFPYRDIHGRQHLLSENAGNVVLLEFWAPWCIPCRKGFPFLDELQAKNESAGLKVVAVTLEA